MLSLLEGPVKDTLLRDRDAEREIVEYKIPAPCGYEPSTF